MRSHIQAFRFAVAALLSLSLVVGVSLPLAGCGAAAGGAAALHGKGQAEPSAQAKSDLPAVVAGCNALAFDLFRTIRSEEDSVVYSPYGLSLVLTMAMGGAKGDTYRDLANTLHQDLPAGRLFPALGALDRSLARVGELTSASALWGQTGLSYERDYVDLLGETYGAPLRLVDFESDYAGAVKAVNDWTSRSTKGRIPQVAAPEVPPRDKPLFMLTSAVYLKAKWEEPFKPEQTSRCSFHLPGGEEIQVPVMNQTGDLRYASADGVEAVEVPYKDGRLSLLALVPVSGRFEAVGSSLNWERVERLLAAMSEREVRLGLPRFTVSSSPDVTSGLKELGLGAPFGAADFSGIVNVNFWVGEIAERAVITVDEEGTEAAAGATVVMTAGAADVNLLIDRPFYFLIRDKETGAILFLGQVTDPRG
jgi:serpin B